MPSASKKQHNMMAMVANDPKAAKRLGISQEVGKEFTAADKGIKFRKGGIPASINKPKTHHTDGGVPNYSTRKVAGFNGGGMAESKAMMKKEVDFMKKKGAPKSMIKHEMKEAAYAAGGTVKKLPTSKQMGSLGMKAGGCVKMSKGGGVESKGKTKGRMC
jgi:hypothetical protein